MDITCGLLMAMEIGKGIDKGKERIHGNLIMRNKGK